MASRGITTDSIELPRNMPAGTETCEPNHVSQTINQNQNNVTVHEFNLDVTHSDSKFADMIHFFLCAKLVNHLFTPRHLEIHHKTRQEKKNV